MFFILFVLLLLEVLSVKSLKYYNHIIQSTTTKRNTILYSTLNVINKNNIDGTNTDSLKLQILQLGSALDRGQAYNPTSGDYYQKKMNFAKDKINELIKLSIKLPETLEDIEGEWELVLTTVPHGIFRSSPFFLGNN